MQYNNGEKIKKIPLGLIGFFGQIDYNWNKHMHLVMDVRSDSREFYFIYLC